MPSSGKGRKRILILGEAPGTNEDNEGTHFVGKAGTLLENTLHDIGVDMRRDCWMSNALICRPPDNKIKDKRAIGYCRPNLTKTLEELKPEVIVLLGASAVRSMIGGIWKSNPGSLNRWTGMRIPARKPNAWICPTFNPQALLRHNDQFLISRFADHLAAACELEGYPWTEDQLQLSAVEVVLDPAKAASILRQMQAKGGPIAFDYESNCLKPETPRGRIVCASACWRGRRTIAYPWVGEAIEASRELLHADNCYFIASNMKHEERWTQHEFGQGVKNWLWDTMLAAHVIDNRQGICGLKFQAFALLGIETYNDHVEPFLKTKRGTQINRIHDIEINHLLKYCAMDTLAEYMVFEKQFRALGMKPLWWEDEAA